MSEETREKLVNLFREIVYYAFIVALVYFATGGGPDKWRRA